MSTVGISYIHENTLSTYVLNYDSYIINILYEQDNQYYYIEVESSLLYDISKMPDYIQSSWVDLNRKNLKLSIINKHIRYNKERVYELSVVDNIILEGIIKKLIEIRRDLIINNILD